MMEGRYTKKRIMMTQVPENSNDQRFFYLFFIFYLPISESPNSSNLSKFGPPGFIDLWVTASSIKALLLKVYPKILSIPETLK